MPGYDPKKRRIRVSDETADLIKGLHPEIKRRVKSALKMILSAPNIGKALKDELRGLHSDKVGRFRIIYRLSSRGTIEIVAIGPRKIIYELTYRIVRKEKKKT
jgi:mRNA interferase RelE/StbE